MTCLLGIGIWLSEKRKVEAGCYATASFFTREVEKVRCGLRPAQLFSMLRIPTSHDSIALDFSRPESVGGPVLARLGPGSRW